MVQMEYIYTGYHNDLGGAEIRHFEVKPKEKCTLLDFMLSVLKTRENDSGYFRVQKSSNCVEFKKGEGTGSRVVLNSFTESELQSTVKYVTAMGSYTLMHYDIVLEDNK